MPSQLNEDQIIDVLGRLSPQARRKVLRRLISDLEELDLIVEKNQEKLRVICKERGVDFNSLSEDEREEVIDRILHEE